MYRTSFRLVMFVKSSPNIFSEASNCKLHPRNEQSNTKKLLDAFRQEIGNSDVEELISDMHSMRAEKFLQYQKGRKIV